MMSYYGTTSGGDDYFNELGTGADWLAATLDEKTQYLKRAAKLIDRFSYKGNDVDGQALLFPREDQTEVPDDILHAAYESANRMAAGWDPDAEAEALAAGTVKKRVFGVVSTEYFDPRGDTESTGQPFQIYGLPSKVVYDLLSKWFVQQSVRLNKV